MDNNNNPNAQAAAFSPATDFIETPIDNAVDTEPISNEKSINVIDETPETEELISSESQSEPASAPAPASVDDNIADEIHFDPDRAFDPENDALFNALREKLAILRRERNELLNQIDKKEDELTVYERTKTQYEVAGRYDDIDNSRFDTLNDEIYKLDLQRRFKERSIHSILGLLHTL